MESYRINFAGETNDKEDGSRAEFRFVIIESRTFERIVGFIAAFTETGVE